jgi:hypothetical protein
MKALWIHNQVFAKLKLALKTSRSEIIGLLLRT